MSPQLSPFSCWAPHISLISPHFFADPGTKTSVACALFFFAVPRIQIVWHSLFFLHVGCSTKNSMCRLQQKKKHKVVGYTRQVLPSPGGDIQKCLDICTHRAPGPKCRPQKCLPRLTLKAPSNVPKKRPAPGKMGGIWGKGGGGWEGGEQGVKGGKWGGMGTWVLAKCFTLFWYTSLHQKNTVCGLRQKNNIMCVALFLFRQ